MMKRLILLLLAMLMANQEVISQNLVLQPPSIMNGAIAISTENLLDFTLLGFDPNRKYSLEVNITYDAGCVGAYQTVAFLQVPYVLFASTGMIDPSVLPVYNANWQYTNPTFQSILMQSGTLPPGCYEVCYKVVDMLELTSTYACTSFRIESIFPFYLLTPFDQSEVDDPFPILSWTPYDVGNSVSYRITLCEVYAGQTDVEAILSNIHKFGETDVSNTFIQYPVYASPLEKCRHYAWQVDVIQNNNVIKSSEVWEFNTPCENDLDTAAINATFYQLGEDQDHIPFIISGDTLRVMLHHPYIEISAYRFSIQSLNESQINEIKLNRVDHHGLDLDIHDLQTGENLFMIDLDQIGYIPGNQYLLKAENQKNASFLHFQYLKPE